MFTSSLPRVYVAGANAYGYTTAILLLLQGYKVTLMATRFPGDPDYSSTANHPDDTTSQWQTLASMSDASLQEYDISSFKMFWKLAKSKAYESGIMIGSSFKYYQEPTEDQSNPWWKHIVPGFEVIQKQELPKNTKLGYHYTTVLINSKRYIHWLQTQFLAMGGRQRKTTMSKLSDAMTAQDHVNILVNCTDNLALGCSSTTARNPTEQKVQQQQWIINNASQVRKSVSVNTKDEDLYLYPRMDGTIVFGSRQHTTGGGDVGTTGSHTTARNVLNRISEYCPELTWGKGINALDITMDQEPVTKSIRQHGPRIENQLIVTPSGRKLAVTHNYGHDGYQSSWGSSKRAVTLVNDAFANLKKDSQAVSELLSRL
ncbi:hypothetical protein BCR42DRAFT_436360 [Absidia repens]|uniref:FAD dependent oxidoreductase domain-containing protein n=1 Tax=Absidia repens TaxID=90262 RepID=A0A1X2IP29_9FUNG|nr:hypothetical protein BCR42DRAFT_436360 [Absidia repens]